MAERTGDYEWHIEGEEAEAFLYAPDETVLEYPRLRTGIEAATRLPGVGQPIYAAASPYGSGWAVSSSSHIAPGLVSAPRVGVLLVAGSPLDRLGLPPEELLRLLTSRLSEVRTPYLGDAELQAACGSGARWAAEQGLIQEEDLDLLGAEDVARGEPEALGRRALAAGERDPRPGNDVRARVVGRILDEGAVEELGLHERALIITASADSGELGRLALEGHRQRMISRDLDDSERLISAPLDTEEAADLKAAVGAAGNYATTRASLLLHALRRALRDVTGGLEPVACWSTGGLEESEGAAVHRRSLARLGSGAALVCGDTLALGTGGMLSSAPPFDTGDGNLWPWEEAGLLQRAAVLETLDGHREG